MTAAIVALIVAVSVLLVLVVVALAVGVQLGGRHGRNEAQRVRLEAGRAQRQLHDLTRQAFVAMAEHVRPKHER